MLLLNLNNRSGVAINVRVEMKSSATLLSFDSVSRMHGLVEIRVLRLYLMWMVDFIFNNQNLEKEYCWKFIKHPVCILYLLSLLIIEFG
jgi:hypothetical protein